MKKSYFEKIRSQVKFATRLTGIGDSTYGEGAADISEAVTSGVLISLLWEFLVGEQQVRY